MRVFQDLDSVQLAKRLFTSHDELKGLVPVPIKEVHLNKCPILMPIDYCKKEHFERWGIDHKRCLENLTLLRQQTNLRDRFKAIYNKPYTSSSQDVDSQLYDGFFADVDRQIMDRILRTAPEQLSTLNLPFSDRRLPELFFRYRARNFPHTLSEKEKQDWLEHRKKMLTRSRIEEYKNKLQSLSGEYKGDEGKEGLINALYEYLQWVIPKE
ncbi:Exodeoxyribonuclease I [Candidatus Liberibacter asiaticus]|nr:Exodeoxyribonuclease I [Candidatus Liberibacter asiaticus]